MVFIRLLAICWMVLALAVAPARAQGTPPLGGDGVVIAMLLNVEAGRTPEAALRAMKDVGAYMRGKPGFLDGALLASTFPGNRPSHVYLSRWRTQEDWESLAGRREFLDLLMVKGDFFNWSSAEVFRTVR